MLVVSDALVDMHQFWVVGKMLESAYRFFLVLKKLITQHSHSFVIMSDQPVC